MNQDNAIDMAVARAEESMKMIDGVRSSNVALPPSARAEIESVRQLLRRQTDDAKAISAKGAYLSDAQLKEAVNRMVEDRAEGIRQAALKVEMDDVQGEVDAAAAANRLPSSAVIKTIADRQSSGAADSMLFDAAYEMHKNPDRSAREILEEQYGKLHSTGFDDEAVASSLSLAEKTQTPYGSEDDRAAAYRDMGRKYNGSADVSLTVDDVQKYSDRYHNDDDFKKTSAENFAIAEQYVKGGNGSLDDGLAHAMSMRARAINGKSQDGDEAMLGAARRATLSYDERNPIGFMDRAFGYNQDTDKNEESGGVLTEREAERLKRENPEEWRRITQNQPSNQNGSESAPSTEAPSTGNSNTGSSAGPERRRGRYAQNPVGRGVDPQTGRVNEPHNPSRPSSNSDSNEPNNPSSLRPGMSGKGSGQDSSNPLGRILNNVGNPGLNFMDRFQGKLASGINNAGNMARNAANKLKAWGTRIRNAGHALVAAATNPATWITLLAILLVLVMITTIETFGPTDIACNSMVKNGTSDSSSEGGGKKVDASKEQEEAAKKVYSVLKTQGLDENHIGAVLSNFKAESGVDPTTVETIYSEPYQIGPKKKKAQSNWDDFTRNTVFPAYAGKMSLNKEYYCSGSGGTCYPGIGLAQWTGEGAEKLIGKAKAVNQEWSNIDYQIAYMIGVGAPAQGGGSGWWKKFQSQGGSPESLAGWFEKNFEGNEANMAEHQATASSWVDKMKGWNVDSSYADKVLDIAKKLGTVESAAVSSSSSSSGDMANCIKKDDSSNGSTSGSKECDKGGCDFSWMCKDTDICKNGDGLTASFTKIVYPKDPSLRYQCVWYAWNRLGMLHPGWKQGKWNIVMGNGGDIWSNAQGQAGWQVDTTPHPGDGISGHAQPFAGSTHVAVVEKVEGDRIYISEGNYGGHVGCGAYKGCWDSYHTRWLTKDVWSKGDIHFFRHTSWANDNVSGK